MPEQFADLLAFPFSRAELMDKPPKPALAPEYGLSLCHATTSPPTAKLTEAILGEHNWFVRSVHTAGGRVVKRPEDFDYTGLKVVGGLQHPPLDAATPKDWQMLKRAGIHLTTLAYEQDTPFAGGFASDGPLTEAGKRTLRYLSAANIGLDLSHMGVRSSYESIRFTIRERLPLPLVISHSACFTVHAHGRNAPDNLIRSVAEQGGVIGIPLATFMLHDRDNSSIHFLRHIQHAVSIAGEDHVALGSDATYKYIDPADDAALIERLRRTVDRSGNFRARTPSISPRFNRPDRLIAIADMLGEIGFATPVIEKILWRNANRLLRSLVG